MASLDGFNIRNDLRPSIRFPVTQSPPATSLPISFNISSEMSMCVWVCIELILRPWLSVLPVSGAGWRWDRRLPLGPRPGRRWSTHRRPPWRRRVKRGWREEEEGEEEKEEEEGVSPTIEKGTESMCSTWQCCRGLWEPFWEPFWKPFWEPFWERARAG